LLGGELVSAHRRVVGVDDDIGVDELAGANQR
jgi:hypothetical protein